MDLVQPTLSVEIASLNKVEKERNKAEGDVEESRGNLKQRTHGGHRCEMAGPQKKRSERSIKRVAYLLLKTL